MNTKYKQGIRREREVCKFLTERGYNVTRSAGSKGAFDVIAYNQLVTRFIQVKNTHSPKMTYTKDIKQIKDTNVSPRSTKELWVFQHGKGCSEVVMLQGKAKEIPDGAKVTFG